MKPKLYDAAALRPLGIGITCAANAATTKVQVTGC